MGVDLTRTVRFCVNDPSLPGADEPADNAFAGYPSMRGLGRYYELHVTCRGEVDPITGYFLNIKAIDRATRASALPIIANACARTPGDDPARVLTIAAAALNDALGGLVRSVRWSLSPYYSIQMAPLLPNPSAFPTAAGRAGHLALLRQQFDFAAAHRLSSPGLDEAANRETFGKCSNPRGHGHNYRVEPCVEFPVDPAAAGFGLRDLERIVARTILDRYDHTHLNEDTAEFDQRLPGGLNPSVENIAKVFYELLAPAVASCGKPARLRSITVWETDKTSCTYPTVD